MDLLKQEKIIENEKEWRKHILSMQVSQTKEIKNIRRDISGLKVKVAGFASVFGLLGAYITKKLGL